MTSDEWTITIGARDREWVNTNLHRLADICAPDSVHAVRATVVVETSRPHYILGQLYEHLDPVADYRWLNIKKSE